jgi:hypothetical protein
MWAEMLSSRSGYQSGSEDRAGALSKRGVLSFIRIRLPAVALATRRPFRGITGQIEADRSQIGARSGAGRGRFLEPAAKMAG